MGRETGVTEVYLAHKSVKSLETWKAKQYTIFREIYVPKLSWKWNYNFLKTSEEWPI